MTSIWGIVATPDTLTSPFTASKASGVVVPIPTQPTLLPEIHFVSPEPIINWVSSVVCATSWFKPIITLPLPVLYLPADCPMAMLSLPKTL